MKKKINKRKKEYIPDVVIKRINELVQSGKRGYKNVRHDKYIKIVGTIIYKCVKENESLFFPVPLGKNYWLKVIGGNYYVYISDLENAGIITVKTKGRKKLYQIDMNLLLQGYEIIGVPYKTLKEEDETIPTRIEKRLGNRIIKSLQHVTVNYQAFDDDIRAGDIDIEPEDYEIDISQFPPNMDINATIHYPNGIVSHRYRIKTLIKKAQESKLSIYYDKDKIRLIDPDTFSRKKRRNFLFSSRLNLQKLAEGQFEISRDSKKTRRVFHVGVFLPNRALNYIKIDNEPVVGIDAVTSQFQIIANLFYSFAKTGNQIASEFSGKRKTFINNLFEISEKTGLTNNAAVDFYIDVLYNDFYEVVRKFLHLNHRSQAKIFCFSIIFSKPTLENAFKTKIEQHYPMIIEILDKYKTQYGYEQLAINLQAIESEIFIDHIFNQLIKQGINCFTRHDSIITSRSNADITLQTATKVFENIGFRSKFKVEKYYPDNSVQFHFSRDELAFVFDIVSENDILRLGKEQLYFLLEEGGRILNDDEYDYLESRILEWDKNSLPIDDLCVKYLYNISMIISNTIK